MYLGMNALNYFTLVNSDTFFFGGGEGAKMSLDHEGETSKMKRKKKTENYQSFENNLDKL